jgi:hypothetical protein
MWPGGPGPRIYIPQEQGGPVIIQALGSHLIASQPPLWEPQNPNLRLISSWI